MILDFYLNKSSYLYTLRSVMVNPKHVGNEHVLWMDVDVMMSGPGSFLLCPPKGTLWKVVKVLKCARHPQRGVLEPYSA